MTNDSNIQWKRILVEGAAIIASILLAFAIDAWWDSVKAQSDTQEILNAVQLEMESNLAGLRESIDHHVEIVEAIRAAQNQASIKGLISSSVLDVEVFEPSTGALDTLVTAGMLGNISDPDLQISLGGFSGLVGDLNLRELRALEFRDAARRRIAEIGVPLFSGRGEGSETVQTDVLMLNLLTMRLSEEDAAIRSARTLETYLTELLLKLDSVN
jgi:hypothetical protein